MSFIKNRMVAFGIVGIVVASIVFYMCLFLKEKVARVSSVGRVTALLDSKSDSDRYGESIQELRVGESLPREDVRVIEKVVSSAQLWRPIQDRVKDTVVQIFSHVAVTDLLRPYRSPTEGSAYGSGFFISDQGDIITNAHVIEQAKAVWVQIPSLGKRIIDVDIVGMSPI